MATTAARITDRLTPVEEAREMILERAHWLGFEPVPLHEALGRVLADDVEAVEPVPRFDNSSMDGYALRAADTAAAADGPVALAIVDESRAGHPSTLPVGPGEAIAISTGAVLPAGADAVVRVEDVVRDGDDVSVSVPVALGNNVRRIGDDIAAGTRVLSAGTTIGAAELGVLASLGVDPVLCSSRPRVAIIVSGDELTDPAEPLGPGQIHDANAYTLRSLAVAAGAEVVVEAKVGDDPTETGEAIADALEEADLLLVSGGISVGPHDHVKGALAENKIEQLFWRIALKPGKPTWFGVREKEAALVVGLPGNPVSAMVCFLLLVRPALRKMLGTDPAERRMVAHLDDDCEREPRRLHAVRCGLELREDGWHARSTGGQASHILTSMLGADGLALIPAGNGPLTAGSQVEVELLPSA
ncbi:MAG TPA: gephyrin-like molybdotransferase Glp [Solirubrobacterales bacterium]